MKKLLFVDDEPNVLAGLRRMLYPMRNEWSVDFVRSGQEALQKLAETEYDAIVTDFQMPGMNGLELLQEVVNRYPATLRLVLSGTADQLATLPAMSLAHQYLSKPCDATLLRDTLNRLLVDRFPTENAGLKNLVNGIESLPSLPAAYWELTQLLQSPEASAIAIGQVIGRDAGMSAKLLQLANSAYFGFRREITNAAEAVVLLGVEAVKAVALSVSVFSRMGQKCAGAFNVAALSDHSIHVAVLARTIARRMRLPQLEIDQVFTAGILHDAGKLVLACHRPDQYREVIDAVRQNPLADLELEVRLFGASHAEIASYLLWLWGLPELTTRLVALHHGPIPADNDPAARAVIALRAAEGLAEKHWGDQAPDWLTAAGYGAEFVEWSAVCDEVRSRKED